MQRIKRFFQSIFDEFIYGGHLLSLGAASIVYTSSVLLSIKITWDCLLIVYLGTQIIYLYNRYNEFNKDILTNPERTRYLKKYLKCLPFIIIFHSLLITALLIYFQKFSALFSALFLLLLGLWYSYSLKNVTRKIVGFKTLFVSLMWAILVFFSAVYYSNPINLAVILVFTFVFLRWLVNTSFFDIKDIESDKKEELKTLPVLFGKEKFLNYLNLVNIVSFIPLILGIYLKIVPLFSLSLILFYFYSFYYLKKAKTLDYQRIRNISYIMVDGEYILWLIVIFLSRFLANYCCVG